MTRAHQLIAVSLLTLISWASDTRAHCTAWITAACGYSPEQLLLSCLQRCITVAGKQSTPRPTVGIGNHPSPIQRHRKPPLVCRRYRICNYCSRNKSTPRPMAGISTLRPHRRHRRLLIRTTDSIGTQSSNTAAPLLIVVDVSPISSRW